MTAVKFLRLPDVRDRVGLSRSQIYRMIQAGTFPSPLKLSPQVSVWSDHEIDNWQREALTQAGKPVPVTEDSSTS